MPLNNNSQFSMVALSAAIDALPASPTQIRGLNLFTPKFLTTTYARIEHRNGVLSLVQSTPRGETGGSGKTARRASRTFEIPHLSRHDIIRADEVQNLRGFGTDKAATVESVVNDKLAAMKADLEMTREHLMLGALQGEVKDADGTLLFDLYKEFGLTHTRFNCKLNVKTTNAGEMLDKVKRTLRQKAGGESINGFIALCSPEFMDKLKYHDSTKEAFKRYREGELYREDTGVSFQFNGVQFVEYYSDFGKGDVLAAGSAILLPAGTRGTFEEYFAPADTNAAVNTKAQAYYASREKLNHDKGWDIEAQTNPLPLVTRPELLATLLAE